MSLAVSKLRIDIRESTMAEAILDIKQWGNNLGVRLPAAVAKAAHLHADQRVRVSVEEGRVVITPVADPPLSLEQRLALFDPARHGGEAMATKALGTERW
jgi:antitoxin MazE